MAVLRGAVFHFGGFGIRRAVAIGDSFNQAAPIGAGRSEH